QQYSRKIGIEWKVVFGILGLDLVYQSIDHAAADPHREFSEVDVPPLQGKNFADPEAQALRHNHHRPIGFWQQPEYSEILPHGQDDRLLSAPAGRLNFNQRHGIPTNRDQLPEHRFLEQTMHQSLYLSLGFG